MAEGKVSSKPTIDRENTCPFLLRTFVKTGGFHTLDQFEEGPLPKGDEHQLYTWKDATLREIITLLRASSPSAYRHPLARFSFRIIFNDPARHGRVGSRDLGLIHARELINTSLLTLEEDEPMDDALNGNAEDRTLEELRLVPGDLLDVAVMTPYSNRNDRSAPGPGFALRGMGTRGGMQPGRGASSADRGGHVGWNSNGRGTRDDASAGGHWRGRGGAVGPGGMSRGVGRGTKREFDDDRRMGGERRPDRDADRERDRGRDAGWSGSGRAPLPRRERDYDRAEDVDMDDDKTSRERSQERPSRRRSPSKSRSPAPRRDDRY